MPGQHELSEVQVAGHPALMLRCPEAGFEATYVPRAGMVGCSLRHHGQELLGQRGGLQHYIDARSTMGIPLLFPWANRLAAARFELDGQQVDLALAESWASYQNGLPIHGLVAGHPGWTVIARQAGAEAARLSARLAFGADEQLIAAFPFAQEVQMDVTLRHTTLAVSTTVRATGGHRVPIAFGYHPYLQLPGVPRSQWEVELPVRERLVVDERQLPTGEREPAVGVGPGPLEDRVFDDGYAGVAPGATFALAGGGRRLELRFSHGFPVAQVYAPAEDDVVAFEPMTAPANALISGDGLRWLEPGDAFQASFELAVFG